MGMSYLVLQIDRGVEVGDLRVDRFANHLTLTRVHDSTHLYRSISDQSLEIPWFERYVPKTCAGGPNDGWKPPRPAIKKNR